MNTSESGQEYISISIDNMQAKDKAKETADSFSNIGKSAEQAGKQMDNAVERLGRQAATQSRYIEELNNQYSEQKKRIAELDRQIISHKELQELNRKEVEELNKQYKQAKETQGEWTANTKYLKAQLNDAREGYKMETDAIKALNLEKQKAAQQAKDLQSESKRESDSLKDTTRQLKQAKEEAAKIPSVNEQIANSMKTVAKLSAGYLSVKQAKAFLDTATKIRGELELTQTQLQGLFGRQGGAQIFSGAKDIALQSGLYSTAGLTQAAETLNIYGEQTENIIPMLREFGDVAMGNEQKLNSLATAFGRVQMEGKLSSLTLRTMVYAGFNPLNEIARTTGQSMDSLRQKMRNGEITITQVRDAFKTATAEGGKYYGMTEKLGSGIKAEQERLQLMIKQVYAKWGEQHESLILSSIKLKQWVVQNIGEIAKWLGVLIGTYGTYKTAVITLNAVEAIQAAGYVRKIRLLRLMAVAQAALNTVMSMNPYVLAATALGTLTAAVIAFTNKSTIAADATNDWNKRENDMAEAHRKRKEKLNELLQKIQDETSSEYERQDALNELKRILPSVFNKYSKWIDLQNELAQATATANEQLQQQNIIEGGNAVYNKDTQMLEDLKKYRDAQSKMFNGREEKEIKVELIRKYPELFTEDKKQQQSMRARPGMFSAVGFKGQGTFETTWHATNQLIKSVESNVEKGVKETQKKLATAWDASLPNRSNKQINDMVSFYRNEIRKFDSDNRKGSKITKHGNVTAEERTAAPNPRSYIEFKDSTGHTVRITRSEAQRRLDAAVREQNAAKNNNGKDFLKEAQADLTADQKAERNVIKNRQSYRTSAAYERALADAKRKVEDAEAVVKRRSLDSSLTKSDAKATQNTAQLEAEQAKARDRMDEENRRYQLEREKQARENGYNTQQAEIDGMQEGEAKKLQQAKLNHQKQIDELKEQERQLYEQKVEHAKALWEADPKSKGAGFWSTHTRDKKTGAVSGIAPLTDEETSGIEAQRKSEDIRYGNEVQQILQQSMDSLIEYYKNFGTLEEQRYAIAKEYDEKIAKAATEGQEKSLQAQKAKELASADAKSMAMGIDWSHTFEGIGNVLGDIARQTLEKVEKYMNTDEFKRQKPSDQKAYTDLRQQLLQETGGEATSPFNFNQWGDIAKQVKEYQESVRSLTEKTKAHREAVSELEQANKKLASATTDDGKKIAQDAVDAATTKVQTTGKDETEQDKDTQDKRDKLKSSTEKATNGMKNFANALQEINGGSLYGFANGITKLITGLGGASKSLGELGGKVGGIIGAILQILDALGDDPKGFINGIFEKITNIVETILADLPELVGSIIKDVGSLIMGVVEGIGSMFGAKDGWINGSNAKEVKKITEELTKSNDALRTSIDGLKDSIKSEHGVNAINDTQKALEAQQRINENSLNILEAQMRYHATHKSNAKKWRMTSGQYSQINQVLSEYTQRHPEAETKVNRVYSLDDILKLTPEQMNEIRTRRADIWTAMLGQGKYDKSEYWEAYADQAGKTEGITNMLREKLTNITFDSMYDNFVDKLMDMETKAEDFTKDINRQFAKSLLDFAIGTQMGERLKQWWQSWADTIEKQGTEPTKVQIDKMRSEYETYVEEGLQTREWVFNITGFNETGKYNQDSSKSVLEGVTQDQIQELNGRMASVQINLDKIAMQIQADYERNGNQIATMQDIRNIMDDLLDMQYQGIEHLQKIEVYTSELPAIRQDISRIKKQTARL